MKGSPLRWSLDTWLATWGLCFGAAAVLTPALFLLVFFFPRTITATLLCVAAVSIALLAVVWLLSMAVWLAAAALWCLALRVSSVRS